MIFAAFLPSVVAVALFWSLSRKGKPRPTTKAEREAVAAQARRWRVGLAVVALALPTLVVATLHVTQEAGEWLPKELR